jgi:hypothetical protein
MNIEDFVRETLVQITNGVTQAQRQLDPTGALVNPRMKAIGKEHSIGEVYMHAGEVVSFVEFDVAVGATEGKETKGGIGVVAGVIGLGSSGKSDSSSRSESRIKFKVPLLLPAHRKTT